MACWGFDWDCIEFIENGETIELAKLFTWNIFLFI